jgi:hypothetical protein
LKNNDEDGKKGNYVFAGLRLSLSASPGDPGGYAAGGCAPDADGVTDVPDGMRRSEAKGEIEGARRWKSVGQDERRARSPDAPLTSIEWV